MGEAANPRSASRERAWECAAMVGQEGLKECAIVARIVRAHGDNLFDRQRMVSSRKRHHRTLTLSIRLKFVRTSARASARFSPECSPSSRSKPMVSVTFCHCSEIQRTMTPRKGRLFEEVHASRANDTLLDRPCAQNILGLKKTEVTRYLLKSKSARWKTSLQACARYHPEQPPIRITKHLAGECRRRSAGKGSRWC